MICPLTLHIRKYRTRFLKKAFRDSIPEVKSTHHKLINQVTQARINLKIAHFMAK